MQPQIFLGGDGGDFRERIYRAGVGGACRRDYQKWRVAGETVFAQRGFQAWHIHLQIGVHWNFADGAET